MKKIYSLLLLILISAAAFSQGAESFTNMPASATTYATRTWIGDGAISWTAGNARTDGPTAGSAVTGMNSRFVIMRNTTGILSATNIPNGIATLTFLYAKAFTSASNIPTFGVFVNGTQIGSTITASSNAAQLATFTPNISGTFSLEIRQLTPNDGGRLAIDDVIWTANNATPCTEPAAQPTALTFGTITASSIAGSFTATTADKYIVIRSTSNTLSATPVDGTTYALNNTLGGGTVIANGTATSFTDIGLAQSTIYYYYVFAYNDVACSGGPNYNVASYPTPNNATTLAIPACTTPTGPSNPITLTPSNTSITGSFTGSGASKYLIIKSTSLPPLGGTPTDGTIYTVGQTIGNGTVVTYTTATNFVANTLTPATIYYFYIFAANDGCTGTPPIYSTSFANGNSTTTNNTGIPPGYYDAAVGLTCAPLKTAISTIITTGHTQNNYSGLDNIEMLTTDDRLNDAGTATIVWDMYSDNPTGPEPYTYTFAQGGSTATAEGQGWNKEHSFPNSWFSASSSTANFPGADLFHLYPTDIRVNSLRGNLPYGRVATAATTTLNGSKIGSSAIAFPGYSGQVFEPIDTYKGDLARAALYMVTRYQADQASWENLQPTGDVLMDGTTYPSVEIEYLKMLIQWHNQDPVSTKELDRNNTVYGFQGNRNPFIDHPEYVGQIWSTACGLALPINLNYFNAKLMENNIQLNWNADNAVGFSHFIIERSVDGINFSKIGQVKGTSNNNYAFTDKDFPNGKGIYYKLKMVDNDGAFKNSAIVFVKLNNNFSNALVYPNPTLGPLYIKLNEALYTNSTLQVSDVTGRILKQQTVNSFTRNINLDVKELSAGRYFIKISNSTQIINQSFVIMK
jgi:endonuclease I